MQWAPAYVTHLFLPPPGLAQAEAEPWAFVIKKQVEALDPLGLAGRWGARLPLDAVAVLAGVVLQGQARGHVDMVGVRMGELAFYYSGRRRPTLSWPAIPHLRS